MGRTRSLLPILVAVLAISVLVQGKVDKTCPDPFVDPQTDTCNPLRYIPSKALNIVAAVLYFITAIALTARHFRKRANYFLCLVIGAWCEAVGLVLRIVLRSNPHSTGIYIVQYLFVVLSPCAFLAGDYILLGRLVSHLNGDIYLRPLKPRLVSWTFVLSDVATFLIQAAGGGLSISDNIPTAEAGGHIFLAGIAAQMASFILFSCMWAIFAVRVYRGDKSLWNLRWRHPLHYALGFTCICFLIRSVFRTVELSQGYIGYLATHERFFLGLDTLPLWLGITVYVIFWPGDYITADRKILAADSVGGSETGSGTGAGGEMRQVGMDVDGDGHGSVPSRETVVEGEMGRGGQKIG